MLGPFRSLLVCAVFLWAAPAPADPIVFDFEDGLQGWTTGGSATRVNTQVLGGEWAIFGDGLVHPSGGNRIWIDIDLTDIASISVEQFFAGDAAEGTNFLWISIWETALQVSWAPRGAPGIRGFGPLSDSPDPAANPGLRTFDLDPTQELPFEGLHRVTISWGGPWSPIFSEPAPDLDRDRLLGFVDNITFHPIPEAATVGLLGLGIVGLLLLRRSIHG